MAMFDKFLRVGDYVINTGAIAHVDLYSYDEGVSIAMLQNSSVDEDRLLYFSGDDAETLRWLLSNKANDHLGNLTDFWRDIIKAEQLDKDRGHVE